MENKEYENIVKVPLSPIGQDELDANSVGEVQIQNGAITAKKIRAGQILTDHLAAGSVTADKIFGNAISTYSLTVASRVKGSTVVFNVVSDGTYLRKLTWTSGALRLSKVVFGEGENLGDITETTISQSISSGYYTFTDSDTEYYFYVVWEADDNGEPKDSATLTVQKSQEYPMTQNAVPLIYAWYDSTLKMVQFRAINSINGVLISGNSIIAGSIQADNIKAGTITTQKLNFTPYVIGSNTLDDVANGTNFRKVSSVAIDAYGMVLLDETVEGEHALVLATQIQAGKLYISSACNYATGYDPSTKASVLVAKTVIRSGTQPTTRPDGSALQSGDLWIDTSNGDAPYTYSGSAWIRSYTQIDGGYITTGTINANRLYIGAGCSYESGYNPNVAYNTATNAQTTANNAQSTANTVSTNFGKIAYDTGYGYYLLKGTSTAAPSGSSGLFLGSSAMGYYNGSSWTTYMDSSGNFYLGGTNGFLVWNGSSLTIGNTSYGYLQATSSSVSLRTAQSGGNLAIQSNIMYFYNNGTIYGSLYINTTDSLIVLSSSASYGLDVINDNTSYHIRFPYGGVCNIMYSTYTIASFGSSSISFSQPINCSSYMTTSSYCQVAASSGIYFGSSSYRLYYSTNYIFTSADIELGNSYGITKSSGYKINWDSSSFRFYDGNKTIYFRYGNSKIQGSVDGSNWYDLW